MFGQRASNRTAALLALASLAAPLAVPLLDAREAGPSASVESSHDPGRCGRLHDHAACIAILKTAYLAAATGWRSPADRPVTAAAALAPAGEAPDRPPSSPRTARAPPLSS